MIGAANIKNQNFKLIPRVLYMIGAANIKELEL